MAFIRDYAAASGDPFRFRVPRFIRPPRKVRSAVKKVAKGAFGLARSVIPALVPGLGAAGTIAAELGTAPPVATPAFVPPPMPARPVSMYPLETFEPEPEEEEPEPMYPDWFLQFARSYGLDLGDPGPKPGKLSRATQPPSAHAAAKRTARKDKRTGADPRSGSQKRRGVGSGGKMKAFGKGAAAFGSGVAANAPAILAAIQGGAGGLTSAKDPLAIARRAGFAVPGVGGHRRHMNPANVKALRRGIRRLEGFERLVKSVRKAAHGLRGAVLAPAAVRSHSRGARGHRAGCKCAVCR